MTTVLLKDIPEGHLFKITREDAANYGMSPETTELTFIKIKHRQGETNCITTTGKYGPFIDPDRSVYNLGAIKTAAT